MGDIDFRTDPRVGSRLAGRYAITDRIASGGMATVYRAADEILGRQVAVKIMHPALAADPSFIERFRGEGQNAARLSHPNIVTVYDYGEARTADGPELFIVMELVEGTTLRSLLERFGHLDPPTARHVARGVAAALDHAHGAGIVHRDVKPENVLVTPDGQIKVVDFGIAKALGPHAAQLTTDRPIGTVAYVAPEQISGRPVDARADVYALGAVVYEVLTGRPPFTGDTPQAVAAARLREPVLVTSTTPEIDAAIARATSAEPGDRFATPGEFARALGDAGSTPSFLVSTDHLPAAAAGAAAKTKAPSRTSRGPVEVLPFQTRLHRRKRRRFRLAAAVAVVLAVAAVAAYSVVPKPSTVPDVRGESLEQARAAIARGGLSVGDVTRVYHDVAPEGTVVGTDPDPGTAVKEDVPVTLLVSRGPELFDVPEVTGKPIDQAKAAMSGAGFALSIGRERYDDSSPKGTVLSLAPDRKRAKRGTAFTAVVSKGPELVAVPDVAGKDTDAARSIVEDAGFGYAYSSDFSDEVSEGVVIRTSPAAGDKAPKGSTITVVVSKGPRPFPMPDFVGMTLAAAKTKAGELGLVVRNTYAVPGSGKPHGTVQGQNPPPQSSVRRGTPIDLYYAQ